MTATTTPMARLTAAATKAEHLQARGQTATATSSSESAAAASTVLIFSEMKMKTTSNKQSSSSNLEPHCQGTNMLTLNVTRPASMILCSLHTVLDLAPTPDSIPQMGEFIRI